MTRQTLHQMIEQGYTTLHDLTPLWLHGMRGDFDLFGYHPKFTFFLEVYNELRRREIERATKKIKLVADGVKIAKARRRDRINKDKDFFKE